MEDVEYIAELESRLRTQTEIAKKYKDRYFLLVDALDDMRGRNPQESADRIRAMRQTLHNLRRFTLAPRRRRKVLVSRYH